MAPELIIVGWSPDGVRLGYDALIVACLLAGLAHVMVTIGRLRSDRDVSLGFGGVLWGEVSALADPGAVVQSYLAGLGGGDVRPEHILNMLADLQPRKQAGQPAMMEAA